MDKKQELEELDKIIKPDEELTLEKNILLQYNQINKKKKIGQYFIRIPKNFESLLNLHKGMEVKMVVKIPPRHKNELVKVSLEF